MKNGGGGGILVRGNRMCKYVKIHESANENGNVRNLRSLEYLPQK